LFAKYRHYLSQDAPFLSAFFLAGFLDLDLDAVRWFQSDVAPFPYWTPIVCICLTGHWSIPLSADIDHLKVNCHSIKLYGVW